MARVEVPVSIKDPKPDTILISTLFESDTQIGMLDIPTPDQKTKTSEKKED